MLPLNDLVAKSTESEIQQWAKKGRVVCRQQSIASGTEREMTTINALQNIPQARLFLPRGCWTRLLNAIVTRRAAFFFVQVPNGNIQVSLYMSISRYALKMISDRLEDFLLVMTISRVDSKFASGFFWGNLVSPPSRRLPSSCTSTKRCAPHLVTLNLQTSSFRCCFQRPIAIATKMNHHRRAAWKFARLIAIFYIPIIAFAL